MATYRNLDQSPRIFFLPADQVIPWTGISVIMYLILGQGLKLPWYWILAGSLWGIATWWTLTWNGLYTFFSRWVNPPRWVRAITPYQSILINHGKSRK